MSLLHPNILLVLTMTWAVSTAQVSTEFCDICGKRVGSRFWRTEDASRIYCDHCVRTKPRCATCGTPAGPGQGVIHGHVMCASCIAGRAKCDDCGLPIVREYYQISGKPELYCAHCFKNHPHCALCGRPYDSHFFSWLTKENLCPNCQTAGVRDPREVEKVVLKVRSWMNEKLRMSVPYPIRIQTTDKLPKRQGGSRMFASRELGSFVREGDHLSIILFEGLPMPLLVETAAHELAHAWQSENCPLDQRLILKEGFAQWVAARALAAFHFQEALQSLRSRPDLYGQGYRKVEKIEEERGVEGLFDYIRTVK